MDPFIRDNLYIILKVSERCNLACTYCYFFFHGDESHRQHPPTVRLGVVEALAEFVRDAVGRHGVKRLRIGLHGGEPLLLKKSRLDEICRLLRAAAGDADLEFWLQTNGVLVDEEWISLFEAHRISVGVSFDGPPKVHDRARLTKAGGPSYAETRRGWELLQAAHDAGRIGRPGVLCVIDPTADGGEIYRHLVDDLQVRSLAFIFPDYTWNTAPGGDHVARLHDYLSNVFTLWRERRDYRVNVRHIREMVAPLAFDRVAEALDASAGNLRNQITVSSDGALGTEDVVRTLAPRFRELGLEINSARLEDIAATDVWEELNLARLRPPGCRDCGWWKICRGGRLWNRFDSETGFSNASIYCPALKSLYAEAAAMLLDGGVQPAAIARRLEITSSHFEALMEHSHAAHADPI